MELRIKLGAAARSRPPNVCSVHKLPLSQGKRERLLTN